MGDSPQNQHILQLLVTASLFRLTFGLQRDSFDAVVAKVGITGVHLVTLKEEHWALERSVVGALSAVKEARAARTATRKEKRKERGS
jgi:hypothetical protein